MKCSAVGEYRSWRSVLKDVVPFSGWTVLGFLAKESINIQRYASQLFNLAHHRDGSFVGSPFSSRIFVRRDCLCISPLGWLPDGGTAVSRSSILAKFFVLHE